MKPRLVFRKRIVVGMLLTAALSTGWAVASNMGFKLNFGTIQAVNRLLLGSGLSLDASLDESSDPPTPEFVVELDPCNQDLSPKNSNMGFKLNIKSVPPGGLEVESPDGSLYRLVWNDSIAELELLLLSE